MNDLRIGVVGYCPPSRFDETKAAEMIKDAYNNLESANPKSAKTVISGLTNTGVLKLAYEEAARRGWKTKGIACSKALHYECFPVDEKTIIGENWGDESRTFLNSIDVLVKVGGGNQSKREAEEAKHQGKLVIEFDLPAL